MDALRRVPESPGRGLLFAATLLAWPIFACGDKPDPKADPGQGPEQGQGPGQGQGFTSPGTVGVLKPTPRSQDARVVSLREAIADGDLEVAEELMEGVAALPGLGVEAPLLRARLAALSGEPLKALEWVETARAEFPDDARVAATSVELAATAERYDSAFEELKAAKARFGESPELLRAEAIYTIYRPGIKQGRRGVELLERAVGADPDLPFARWPLSEAHRLYAQSMAGSRLKKAIEHGEKAVQYSAENRLARELLGDMYMTAQRWGEGIAILEGLLLEGEPLEAKVGTYCKNAGVVALTQGDKQLALDYFVRARELGVQGEDLGTGQGLLRRSALDQASKASAALKENDMASAMVHLGRAQRYWPDAIEVRALRSEIHLREGLMEFNQENLPRAQELFELALESDPESLLAQHLLGRTVMERGEPDRAAEIWSAVLDKARAQGIELPDPVHLGLTRAYEQMGRRDLAKGVLERYLEDYPAGSFAPETRIRLKDFQSPDPKE